MKVTTTNLKTGAKSVRYTKTTKKGNKKAKVSKSLKRAINRAINSNIETKMATKEIFKQISVPGSGLNTAVGAGLGLSTDITTARSLPSIVQGDNDADRSGSELKIKDLSYHYSLRARDVSGTLNNPFNQPFYVRIVAYNHRYAIDDFTQTGILDKGNTVGNLDASPDSWLEPYNRKEFKILYSKTFKMCPYYDRRQGDANATIMNTPNGFQSFVYGKFKIPHPKKFLYNKNDSGYPTNFQPFIAFAVCNVDGIGVSASQYRVDVNLEARLKYTDA